MLARLTLARWPQRRTSPECPLRGRLHGSAYGALHLPDLRSAVDPDPVTTHITELYHQLLTGDTSDFTDTDWWIMQWAGYLDADQAH